MTWRKWRISIPWVVLTAEPLPHYGMNRACNISMAHQNSSNGMIYRTLGRTGERVSALGLGGFHLGHPTDPNDAIRIVRSALDRGINFLDNSWDYNDGESER